MGVIISLLILLLVVILIRPSSVLKNPALNLIYWQGAGMRIVGTLVYIYYAFNISDGAVDAFVYDNYASRFAEYFLAGDFSPFTNEKLYRGGELFYTNFVSYPAAFFIIITNNSIFGIYLLFSIVCFVGLVLLYKAFESEFEFLDRQSLLLLFFLFPTLWFWTSTIGKDAFMFLGIGLVCYGIRQNKINYLFLFSGIFILYAFRPPIAYMALIGIASIFIFNIKESLFFRFVKIIIGCVFLYFLFNFLAKEWGIEEFSTETISQLQSTTLHYNNYGGGALEQKSGGLASIPRGVIDVLARPFIWESRNLLSLASSFEITFVLVLLFVKRKSVLFFIKKSLDNKLSTFVLAFLIIYILSVGIFENNIGLIARHRALIFPFLFLMAYANRRLVQSRTLQKKVRLSKAQ